MCSIPLLSIALLAKALKMSALGSRGLMDRALDLKPEVTQGCGFESWLWQEVSRRQEVRPPTATMLAAHCSTWMG